MSRKIAFAIGLALGLSLMGGIAYLLSKEARNLHGSAFIAGYMSEVSTLTFILNESDEAAKSEIIISELCEAISIINEEFDEGFFSPSYIEVIASSSISTYQEKILSLQNEYCSKST